jgi:hypothetical protein
MGFVTQLQNQSRDRKGADKLAKKKKPLAHARGSGL